MTWNPGDDVIAVHARAPQPGGARRRLPRVRRDAARPEDDVRARSSRARRRSSTPRRRCRSTRASAGATSCTASRTRAWRSASAARCARRPARPTASASSRPRTRPSTACRAGERYAAVYEINLSRCIFCGYCEVACPFDAITMGHDYEMSRLQPLGPHLHQGDAARRAARPHAAAGRGRVGRAGGGAQGRAASGE